LEGKLNATINKFQLDQIITYILREYEVFGVQKKNNKIVFDRLNKANDLLTWAEKPIIPFKKILFPNGAVIPAEVFDYTQTVSDSRTAGIQAAQSQPSFPASPAGRLDPGSQASVRDDKTRRKLAFLGLVNCDAEALDIFLKEFSHTDLMPKRSDILVVTSECKPNENCFCTAFDPPKFQYSDMHIQEEDKNFEVFALTKTAEKILDENGVEKYDKKIKIREIKNQKIKLLDLKKIAAAIDDKAGHQEYWQKIAEQCFGCGACTAVCPLCFCFRPSTCHSRGGGNPGSTDNKEWIPDQSLPSTRSRVGDDKLCTNWDSCYSKSFSAISSHNFRPENSDRLYNWYHHKFCRSMAKKNYPLCTGCGRCIDACPAHLNQHGIIRGIMNNE